MTCWKTGCPELVQAKIILYSIILKRKKIRFDFHQSNPFAAAEISGIETHAATAGIF